MTRMIVEVSPMLIRASARLARGAAWATERSFAATDELTDFVAQLPREVNGHRLPRRVTAYLAAGILQRRTLTDLPPVAEPALRQLVNRAPHRFFRQNGHTLISSAAWTRTGTSRRETARAVAVDETVVDAIMAGAARAGLVVEDIVPADEPGFTLSLLPPRVAAQRRRRSWQRTGQLAAVVGMVWLLVLGAPAVSAAVESRRVRAELERLREPRIALQRARVALDSATAMLEALDQARVRRVEIVTVLSAIVAALPDSTSLISATLEAGGPIQLQGRARHPARVAGAIEALPALGRVRLEAITARDTLAGLEWERFRLSAEPARGP